MLPDQHVIGGCNQIISLRFGFPNSFPMVLSTDQSLAFKKRKWGVRGGKENNHTRNLYREEREENDLIEEEKRKKKSGVLLYFFSPPIGQDE